MNIPQNCLFFCQFECKRLCIPPKMDLLMILTSCAYYFSIQETISNQIIWTQIAFFPNLPLTRFLFTSVDHFVIAARTGVPAALIVNYEKLTVQSSVHQLIAASHDLLLNCLVKTLFNNFTERPRAARPLFPWILFSLALSNWLWDTVVGCGFMQVSIP